MAELLREYVDYKNQKHKVVHTEDDTLSENARHELLSEVVNTIMKSAKYEVTRR